MALLLSTLSFAFVRPQISLPKFPSLLLSHYPHVSQHAHAHAHAHGAVTTKCHSSPTSAFTQNQDSNGTCIFGKKSYWDSIYDDDPGGGAVDKKNRRPSEFYSWYCGWEELAPFWSMLVPNRSTARVLIAGIGNDPAPIAMYDSGWSHDMIAFDYSSSGVKRAQRLFGTHRTNVTLFTADARDLPLADGSIDATLDKGTLDVIYIASKDGFKDSVKELGRVTADKGVVVSIIQVIDADSLLTAFDSPLWECTHDGTLAFAQDGEATIDLGAELYSWKRTNLTWHDDA